VGSRIIEDRHNCWPGYDLEGSCGPALNEGRWSVKRNRPDRGAGRAYQGGGRGRRWADSAPGAGSEGRWSERRTAADSGCAAG